jgi:two-component system NtrC family response regulator
VFAAGGEITGKDLALEPPAATGAPAEGPGRGALRVVVAGVVRETERRLIGEALTRCSGNRTAAARELGLSRRGLQIKMRRLGIE